MQQFLSTLLDDPDLFWQEDVQSLWSGYGSIRRYYSPARGQSVIVKAVQPESATAHPRGWSGATSHQRKLHSYEVERAFYAHYASQCDEHCRVPAHLASSELDSGFVLCLEDLDAQGFSGRVTEAQDNQIQQVVHWLANFHARFVDVQAPDLWPEGCYWHLATRQDEWSAMADSELKNAASALDIALKQARYQTLLHGDAKLANFCFDQSAQTVAAVDFQYVGRGVGVRDLAYFLGCCMDDARLEQDAPRWLDAYFACLRNALPANVNSAELEREWRALYAIAWADFHRFLAGWMPTHWKINRYMQRMSEQALRHV